VLGRVRVYEVPSRLPNDIELTGVNLTLPKVFSIISLSGAIPHRHENDSQLEINWS